MKVKINKVSPYRQNILKTKTQVFYIGKQQFILSPYKIDQKNFTGYPTYLQMICTLPDATIDYQYVRFNIFAESTDYKEVIERKAQRFDDIKKGQHKRDFVFCFTPLKKGNYTIKLDVLYKPKYFVNTTQQPDERKQSMQTSLKFDDPFEISQFFVTQDKANSITFPLFIQHTIVNRHPDEEMQFSINFDSQKFIWNFMNDKNQFKLKTNQTYFTVLSAKPQNLKNFLQQKPQTIGKFLVYKNRQSNHITKVNKMVISQGQLIIKYGQKGEIRKKVNFRINDKYLFFKGTTPQKTISKKDIVDVTVRFQKVYNANFGLGDLSILINDSLMQGIKIVKTSKSKINLDQNRFEQVIFSIICLKSGFYHIKGLTLNTVDNRIVNYVNDITLFVENQQQHKAPVFQNTTVVQIPFEQSLI